MHTEVFAKYLRYKEQIRTIMKSSAGSKRTHVNYAVLQIGGKYPDNCDLTIIP